MSELLDLAAALAALSDERPVFHSEADLQAALACILGEHGEVRAEYPVPWDRRQRIDIWLRGGAHTTVVELKYWTRNGELTAAGESFKFRDGADDLERYELWKDVARTERLITDEQVFGGYVIALANNPIHWDTGLGASLDAAFRLYEGRSVEGTLTLSDRARAKARGERPPIELMGRYRMEWQHYSKPAPGLGGEFRSLLLDVGAALGVS